MMLDDRWLACDPPVMRSCINDIPFSLLCQSRIEVDAYIHEKFMYTVLYVTRTSKMEHAVTAQNKPSLSEWLIQQCEERGWSYREAGRQANLTSATTVSRIIAEKHSPSPETLQGLAKAFGVTTEYMMYLAGYIEHDPTDQELTPEVEGLIRRIERLPEGNIRAAAIDALNNMLDTIFILGEDL